MKASVEKKIRLIVRKRLAEALIGSFGFNKNDAIRMNLMRANEASVNATEPPVKSKGGDIGAEPPVQDKTLGKSSQQEPSLETQKDEKPKPKSKDWTELVDECVNYISLASMMVGDNEASNGIKILDKLYEEVSNKLSGMSPGLDETKKKKKK